VPLRETDALRKMLFFQREPYRVMARIGNVGQPVDHSQRKENGRIIPERGARVALFYPV